MITKKSFEDIKNEYGDWLNNKEIYELSTWREYNTSGSFDRDQYLENARKNKDDFIDLVERILIDSKQSE